MSAEKPEDVVTLKEAAKTLVIHRQHDCETEPDDCHRHSEATLHLEAMLGASRRGKVVR